MTGTMRDRPTALSDTVSHFAFSFFRRGLPLAQPGPEVRKKHSTFRVPDRQP